MSNREEELESKVSALQAAVNGLTEELVEMKERVRELEDDRDVGVASEPVGAADEEPTDAADAEASADGDDEDPRNTPASDSEILEPTPTSAESGALAHEETGDGEGDDGIKSEGSEGEDNDGESDGNDIIVA